VAALRRANHIFFVAHHFSWRSICSRVFAAWHRLRAIWECASALKTRFV